MGRRQSALLLLIGFAVAGTGCRKRGATLEIGVEAQPAIVSRIGKVHYAAKVGTNVLVDKEIVPKAGESPFRFEVALDSPPGTETDVIIEAFSAGPNDTIAKKPMLVRRSHAPFVGEKRSSSDCASSPRA